MNTDFGEVITASDRDRGALFAETAARLGTAVQNVEKDFWVCWTLDALFNGLEPGSPRLLFKGGTSLSKAFDLISRFLKTSTSRCFVKTSGKPSMRLRSRP
jgi:Nucleotidyl transferase AbiEii toxin, Type IV TA system